MWKLEFTKSSRRDFHKLAPHDRQKVIGYLRDRVLPADDPRRFGKPLTGDRRGYWRYGVGDLRVIVDVEHDKLVVLVIEIGHRREVYR